MFFTIDHLAALYNLRRADLISYEEKGLLSPLRVGEERYYSPRERIKLEIAIKGKRLNFSLNEIVSLVNAHLPLQIARELTPEQVEAQIQQLEKEKEDLQKAIDKLQDKRGSH